MSAAFTDRATGIAYVLIGGDIKAIDGGAAQSAKWRSKSFAFPYATGFGWAQVSARYASGVVLRLYLDGALAYTTPTLTSAQPVRLPAVVGHHVEIEIESADRVTGVAVSNVQSELL